MKQELDKEDAATFNGSSDFITSEINKNNRVSQCNDRKERKDEEEGGDRVISRDNRSNSACPIGLSSAVDTSLLSCSNPRSHLKGKISSFHEVSVSCTANAIERDDYRNRPPMRIETIPYVSASTVRDLAELRTDSKSKIQRVVKNKNPIQETNPNSSYYDENGS